MHLSVQMCMAGNEPSRVWSHLASVRNFITIQLNVSARHWNYSGKTKWCKGNYSFLPLGRRNYLETVYTVIYSFRETFDINYDVQLCFLGFTEILVLPFQHFSGHWCCLQSWYAGHRISHYAVIFLPWMPSLNGKSLIAPCEVNGFEQVIGWWTL